MDAKKYLKLLSDLDNTALEEDDLLEAAALRAKIPEDIRFEDVFGKGPSKFEQNLYPPSLAKMQETSPAASIYHEHRFRAEKDFFTSLGYNLLAKELDREDSRAHKRTLSQISCPEVIIEITREWGFLSKIFSHSKVIESHSFKKLCEITKDNPQFLLDICHEHNYKTRSSGPTRSIPILDFIRDCVSRGYKWENPKKDKKRPNPKVEAKSYKGLKQRKLEGHE